MKILRLYFKRLGFNFGKEAADKSYLHCRVRKEGGWRRGDGRVAANESKAREELKALLKDMGVEAEGITDKSFKMLGVTRTMAAGVTAEAVALHGRWRSAEMPLRYKHNSLEYKAEVASRIPIV